MTNRVLRITRRTLSWVFLQGTILLGFIALNPFSTTALIVRILMLILAVVLAVGLLPNSYLQRFTVNSLEQPPQRGLRVLLLISILGPVLSAVIAAFAIAANLDTLEFIDRIGVEFMDPRSEVYNIVQYVVMGIVSFFLLVWNLLDLFLARESVESA